MFIKNMGFEDKQSNKNMPIETRINDLERRLREAKTADTKTQVGITEKVKIQIELDELRKQQQIEKGMSIDYEKINDHERKKLEEELKKLRKELKEIEENSVERELRKQQIKEKIGLIEKLLNPEKDIKKVVPLIVPIDIQIRDPKQVEGALVEEIDPFKIKDFQREQIFEEIEDLKEKRERLEKSPVTKQSQEQRKDEINEIEKKILELEKESKKLE